jgi:hypothetical protein
MLLFSVCLAATSVQAKGGKGKGKGNQGESDGSSATLVDIRFRPTDVHLIQQYYVTHPVSLPPGLQKKLAKGKPLPPGWQKKLQPFAPHIDVRLGPPCAYCGRGVVNGYGVIYDKKTAIILDVVQLVGDIVR